MRVTVNDIAREMNIAQGTVSKALHGRVGVNPQLREDILSTAKRMGYQVNRVAQSLARDPFVIGIICPGVWMEYHGLVAKGIREEADAIADFNVIAEFRSLDSLSADSQLSQYVDEFIARRNVNAVLLCPASSENIEEICRRLVHSGIPCAVVGSEISHTENTGCIHINADISGRLAAECMAHQVAPGTRTAVFIGRESNMEHRKKASAYRCAAEKSIGSVCVCETLDDPAAAYAVTKSILEAHPDIRGIYIATGNTPEVCRCVCDLNRTDIAIIGTDAVDATLPFFEVGILRAVMFQSPVMQGRLAIQEIFRCLTERTRIAGDRAISPFLLHESNVREFIEST